MAAVINEPLRDRLQKRLKSLKDERGSYDAHWREMARYIQPRRGRFFRSAMRTEGRKQHQLIINSTAGVALRTLNAGMMAGITSPARIWFGTTTSDPDLAKRGTVRDWCFQVDECIRALLRKSGSYNVLHSIYGDMGLIGTAAGIMEASTKTLARAFSIPPGEYYLAQSAEGVVDTLFREAMLTVRQVVQMFGRDACSPHVRSAWDASKYDEWVEVVQVIEPRVEYDPRRLDAKNMPWASCWFEAKASAGTGLLRESGYRECPIFAPRWNANGNAVYGDSPAMDALGDVKSLQQLEKNRAEVVDKVARPPMQGPPHLRLRGVSLIPGGMTYNDSPTQKLEASVVINPSAIGAIDSSIRPVEGRINAAFYANLWLMMDQLDDRDMTAREVAERHEEKMLQLGPVYERLEDELLNPLITRCFGILQRANQLPPPPDELHGQDIAVEYSSIMAQAQKAILGTSVQRLLGVVGQAYAFQPDIVDNVDFDKATGEIADSLGVTPSIIRSADQVAARRAQRAKQAAQAQQSQNALAASQAAKNLGMADVGDGETALSRMVGPVAAAQAGNQ